MLSDRIKVLVVEDSPVVQQLLIQLLGSDSHMEVVGAASDGAQALDLLARRRPDVVTMDVNMPGMDGFEVTRRIMETNPVPVVIVSSVWSPHETGTAFRALEAGAVAVVATPGGPDHPNHDRDTKQLLEAVRLMSETRLVRRWARQESLPRAAATPVNGRSKINLIAIGASTGGPTVVRSILAALPKDISVPVLIVQHIAPGFIEGLTQWLTESTGFTATIARDGEIAMPARAYFAPDGHHLEIRSDGRIRLTTEPPDSGLRPSIARLFASVADFYASHAAAAILTGMGRDGAHEMKLMRRRGALTIAQDQATSLIFGMPAEAIKLDAAEYVLPPDRIAATLAAAVTRR